MSPSAPVLDQRFDVSVENQSAYREATRGNRLLISVTLCFLVGVQVTVAFALLGVIPWHIKAGPTQQLAIGGLYAILLPLSGWSAYVVFWLCRPGASVLVVNDEGMVLGFDDGRCIPLPWANPRFDLKITRVGPHGTSTAGDGRRGFSKASIVSLRYPSFQLSEAALRAMLDAATAKGLVVRETHGSIGDRSWDLIFIRPARMC